MSRRAADSVPIIHPEGEHPRDAGVLQRDMHLDMLRCLQRPLRPSAAVLDFGCGAGLTMDAYAAAGFTVWGCDIELGAEPHPRARAIESPYRLPFGDDTFDFAFSDQVFEHVQDYPAAVHELARVLRPDGVSLHIFPARWRPIEGHTFVPLAGVVRSPAWLRLWAALGVRNGFQRGMDAATVARVNAEYLDAHTAYPSRRAIRSAFGSAFGIVAFAERSFLASSWGRAGKLAPLGWIPGVERAVSATHSRVVLAAQPLG
jgi:SAM-dependent methyltransferase